MDTLPTFEYMRICKGYVWNDTDFKELSDELKKDFAISLFIQVMKDKTTEKIQKYKTKNMDYYRGK